MVRRVCLLPVCFVHGRGETNRCHFVFLRVNGFIQQVFQYIEHGNEYLLRVLLTIIWLRVKGR